MTLLIGTTVLIRLNKTGYAWMTGIPGIFMTVITMWAGAWLILNQYLPAGKVLLAALSAFVMALMAVVIVGVLRRWNVLLHMHTHVKDHYGLDVKQVVEE